MMPAVVAEASEIRVLVVDDHTATRSGIKAILDAEIGITVVGEATNVESAVSMADRRKPDVVVMDLQLDGDMGGGFAATRRVLDADPKVGVMMFTAFGEHHLLTDGLEAGARGFMVKDATPAEMVRGVRIVAEGGAYLDPSLSADLLRGRGIGQLPGLSGPRARDPGDAGRRRVEPRDRGQAVPLHRDRPHPRAKRHAQA